MFKLSDLDTYLPYPKKWKKDLTWNKNLTWDERFLQLAEFIATWSKDPNKQVGAIIVDKNKRIISIGFNGYPKNISDVGLDDKETKLLKTIHAEENAILFASRDLSNCIIYINHPPCAKCSAKIIQVGIKEVVYTKRDISNSSWLEDFNIAFDMLREANVPRKEIIYESKY